jgi:hypothetical protein
VISLIVSEFPVRTSMICVFMPTDHRAWATGQRSLGGRGFAAWREGLAVRPGARVRGLDDVAR